MSLSKPASATKSLGLEMDKVDAIADSLLQFEQSIANEMEAELLLGKNLNLLEEMVVILLLILGYSN